MLRNRISKQITKEDIIEKIKEYTAYKNKPPTYADFLVYLRDNDMRCNPRSSCYFGEVTWNEILNIAEVGINMVGKYPKEELKEKLISFSKKIGRTPTQYDLDNDPDMPMSKTYVNVFGSYNQALKEINLKENQLKLQYSDDQLISFIVKRSKELGRMPVLREMKADGYPYLSIYSKRQGWKWYVNKANEVLENNQ